MSIAAYRGAGRPEAIYYVERAIELVADHLGIDSTEVRRRNYIQPDQFPYATASNSNYDTGDYDKNLTTALELSKYETLRQEQKQRRESNSDMLMLFGTDIAGALTTLEALPIDVLGMNCSTGPEYMRQPIQYLVERSSLPISVLPNAGLPINVDGEAVYPMEPDPFSEMVSEFTRWGVNIVGGCCGTRPEHLSKLYAKVHAVIYRLDSYRAYLDTSKCREQPVIGETIHILPIRSEAVLHLADEIYTVHQGQIVLMA